MNAFSQTVLWCAIQVAMICVATMLVARIAGRRNPVAEAWCLRSGIILSLLITVMAPVHLPSWFSIEPNSASAELHSSVSVASPDHSQSTNPPRAAETAPTFPDVIESQQPASTTSFWSLTLQALEQASNVPPGAETRQAASASSFRYLEWVIMGSVALGLSWFLLGVVSVHRLNRNSEELSDSRAAEALDIVRACLSSSQTVRLAVADVGSAATIGFFRPVILLPPAWKTWSDKELQAILAHELAHVNGGDFAATVIGQFVLAIHLLHPLVHWVTRRLRIAQEIAADASASRCSGGRTDYATLLATMALRENRQTRMWATQAFLPAPRTLLRRIEMLRDAPKPRTQASWSCRLTTATLLFGTALAVLGLRPTQIQSPTILAADETTQSNSPLERHSVPLSLEWVPNGSLAVMGIKPNVFLQHDEIAPHAEKFVKAAAEYGVSLNHIDSIVLAATDAKRTEPDLVIMRSRIATDWKELRKSLGAATSSEVNGLTVHRTRHNGWFTPDEFTIVIAQSAALKHVERFGKRGTTNRFWQRRWGKIKDKPAAFLLDIGAARDQLYSQPVDQLDEFSEVIAPSLFSNPVLNALAPVIDKGEILAAELIPSGNLELSAKLTSVDASDAQNIRDTLHAVQVLMRNMLLRQQRTVARSRDKRAAILGDVLHISEQLVQSTTIQTTASDVNISTSIAMSDIADLLEELAPAFQVARTEARQRGSLNNLKQLVLALHMYHDKFRQFPPAYSMGKEGKGPYRVSWRVLITPFLNRQDIFDNYHFDEPWDSPHNQRVTANMPAVFAHPDAKPGEMTTAYFAVISEHEKLRTGFGRTKANKIRDFIDGTSNSILLLESKRNVHWAKPDDIEWNPEGPLPKLGGFRSNTFAGARADGSVSPFRIDADADELRHMLTINDGRSIRQDDLIAR